MSNKFNTPWQVSGGGEIICDKNNDLVDWNFDNRKLIVNCVNACAGMDDPVADVAELKSKAMNEAFESLYTSSPENLQNAVNYAQKLGFTYRAVPDAGHPARELFKPEGTEILNKAIAHAKECGFSFADSGITSADWSVKNTPDFFVKNPERKPWHETGEFPPVGTECEINEPKMSYDGRKVHVFANYNGRAFAWDPIDHSAYHSDNPSEFRPIQTEKQKIIKEMLWCFDGFFNGDGDNAGQVCEKIYDQFIAKK